LAGSGGLQQVVEPSRRLVKKIQKQKKSYDKSFVSMQLTIFCNHTWNMKLKIDVFGPSAARSTELTWPTQPVSIKLMIGSDNLPKGTGQVTFLQILNLKTENSHNKKREKYLQDTFNRLLPQ